MGRGRGRKSNNNDSRVMGRTLAEENGQAMETAMAAIRIKCEPGIQQDNNNENEDTYQHCEKLSVNPINVKVKQEVIEPKVEEGTHQELRRGRSSSSGKVLPSLIAAMKANLMNEDEESCGQDPYSDLDQQNNFSQNFDEDVLHVSQKRLTPRPRQNEFLEVGGGDLGSACCKVGSATNGSENEDKSSVFSTIDVASLGLNLEGLNIQLPPFFKTSDDANVGNEIEIEASVPLTEEPKKRRGRKPKAKKNEDQLKAFPFAQTIVNGMISIDMSSLQIHAESNKAKVPTEASAAEIMAVGDDIKPLLLEQKQKKPRKQKLIKKAEGAGEEGGLKTKTKIIKRGRPKNLNKEENESSCDTTSPFKAQPKRGRKTNVLNNATAGGSGGGEGQSSASASRGGPSHFNMFEMKEDQENMEFEQDEVLLDEELMGFEHLDVLNSTALEKKDFRIEEIDGEQNMYRLAPGVKESISQRIREIVAESINIASAKKVKPTEL